MPHKCHCGVEEEIRLASANFVCKCSSGVLATKGDAAVVSKVKYYVYRAESVHSSCCMFCCTRIGGILEVLFFFSSESLMKCENIVFGIQVCLGDVCGNFIALAYILNHLHVIFE